VTKSKYKSNNELKNSIDRKAIKFQEEGGLFFVDPNDVEHR